MNKMFKKRKRERKKGLIQWRMILPLVLKFEFLPGLNYFKIACLFKLYQTRPASKGNQQNIACAESSVWGAHSSIMLGT